MSIVNRAVKSLGLRQRSYQSMFAEGSPGRHVMAELALYANAFETDVEDISHDKLMVMHGRRQMFFHIVNHLRLSTDELEALYVSLAARSAARRPISQGGYE